MVVGGGGTLPASALSNGRDSHMASRLIELLGQRMTTCGFECDRHPGGDHDNNTDDRNNNHRTEQSDIRAITVRRPQRLVLILVCLSLAVVLPYACMQAAR